MIADKYEHIRNNLLKINEELRLSVKDIREFVDRKNTNQASTILYTPVVPIFELFEFSTT